MGATKDARGSPATWLPDLRRQQTPRCHPPEGHAPDDDQQHAAGQDTKRVHRRGDQAGKSGK